MQIGGFIFAKARMEDGRIQSPSPHISPEAIVGTISSAFLGLSFSQSNTIAVPMRILIAK